MDKANKGPRDSGQNAVRAKKGIQQKKEHKRPQEARKYGNKQMMDRARCKGARGAIHLRSKGAAEVIGGRPRGCKWTLTPISR